MSFQTVQRAQFFINLSENPMQNHTFLQSGIILLGLYVLATSVPEAVSISIGQALLYDLPSENSAAQFYEKKGLLQAFLKLILGIVLLLKSHVITAKLVKQDMEFSNHFNIQLEQFIFLLGIYQLIYWLPHTTMEVVYYIGHIENYTPIIDTIPVSIVQIAIGVSLIKYRNQIARYTYQTKNTFPETGAPNDH